MNTIVNDILTLIPTFLRVLASAPVSGSFLTPVVDSILQTAANLIDRGNEGAAELAALTQHIQAMIATGTDPTPEDWAALKARSDAAHASIQNSNTPTPNASAPLI